MLSSGIYRQGKPPIIRLDLGINQSNTPPRLSTPLATPMPTLIRLTLALKCGIDAYSKCRRELLIEGLTLYPFIRPLRAAHAAYKGFPHSTPLLNVYPYKHRRH